MTPQELKSSILQLAIQGKLVEQRPEEGTGEELYRQIQKEKQELIKAGIIKKEKPLPEISEDEIPFDIPESWKLARVSDIAYLNSGNQYQENANGSLYVKVADMNLPDNQTEIKTSTRRASIPRKDLIPANSIIFPKRGGAIATNKKRLVCQEPIGVDSNMMAMTLISAEMLPYVSKWFASIDLGQLATGTSVPQINNKDIYPLLIPIPPLAEQKRIVAKIEELLPYIDRYEKAWSRLEEFNKRFPVDMQKSILQMAIQGKLVEQRPEEGTGEELFQQIQAEKKELIKEGKIKKEKPLPQISEDEIPFDIPDTWTWKRLGNISWYFDAGKSPNCLKTAVTGDEWGVITTTAVQLGYFDEVQNKILPKDFKVNTDIQVRPGDILITRAGPTNRTGIACLVKDIRYNLILSDKIIRINMTNSNIFKDYIIMVLNSPQIRNMIVGLMSGMDRQQVNVSQDKYKTLLIPIPPIAEQKRIVAKLEEILPLCRKLEQKTTERKT